MDCVSKARRRADPAGIALPSGYRAEVVAQGLIFPTGVAFDDMPIGTLPAGTGQVMRFTGTTVLKVENGLITEEIGLDDGLTALRQLGLITAA